MRLAHAKLKNFKEEFTMVNSDFMPIAIAIGIPTNEGLYFILADKKISVAKPHSDTIWHILAECNGYNNPEQIAKNAKMSIDLVNDFLDSLIQLDVICDSREQFYHFNEISTNPQNYTRNLSADEVMEISRSAHLPIKSGERFYFSENKDSQIFKLENGRHSVRNFCDKALTVDQIGQLCDLGYNLMRHATPSGGSLYPLKLFILIAKDQIGLPGGYYEYDSHENALVRFGDSDEEMISFIFYSPSLPYNSPVQFIIAADLSR